VRAPRSSSSSAAGLREAFQRHLQVHETAIVRTLLRLGNSPHPLHVQDALQLFFRLFDFKSEVRRRDPPPSPPPGGSGPSGIGLNVWGGLLGFVSPFHTSAAAHIPRTVGRGRSPLSTVRLPGSYVHLRPRPQ